MAAELLAGLSLEDVPVLGPGFVQSLIGILIVDQSPAPPVQQVLEGYRGVLPNSFYTEH